MSKRPLMPMLLCAAVFAALQAGASFAQTTPPADTPADDQIEVQASVPASRLVASYTELAGSEANAQALIDGLRNGTEFSLTHDVTTTTTTTNPDGTTSTTTTTAPVSTAIVPATGKMGWGEVNLTLALAQALVDAEGSTLDLATALNGSTVTNADGTTTTTAGVLQLRADGMGWGQIGKQLGFNVGALMSASHTAKAKAGSDPATAKADKLAKAEKSAKPERVDKAAKAERPERPARVERSGAPERPTRPERPSRGR